MILTYRQIRSSIILELYSFIILLYSISNRDILNKN